VQVFSAIYAFILGVIVLSGLVGCKTINQDKGGKPGLEGFDAPTKIPVGSLHVVRPGEGFVLIRSTRFLQVEPGTDLVTYGNGGAETSRLRVSPARKGQFVTADIISGMPQVGDQALMDYVAGPLNAAGGPTSNPENDEIQILE
jgi:hypothetical protein